VDVARLAAQATAAARVTVFDSRQLSLGMGFEVHSAARAAGAGRSMAEILSLLEDQISRTHTFAALDTLEYMRRGGRMNPAIAALGGVLQIKPILKMYDGVPTAERVRTRSKAIRRVKELLARHAPFDNVAVVHTGAEARAKELLEEVRGQLPQRDIWVREISPVLGAHIGPGVVGFACLSERR
jgi:DegV family protein with EDD domain